MYKIVMLKKSCTIEEPFSANKMYAPVARGKMVKSKKYIDWIEKNVVIIKNNSFNFTSEFGYEEQGRWFTFTYLFRN